jgi:hypothetical protein
MTRFDEMRSLVGGRAGQRNKTNLVLFDKHVTRVIDKISLSLI